MLFSCVFRSDLCKTFTKNMEENYKKNQTAPVKTIVTVLASESNAHGIAKIATARSNKRKAFWTLLVVLAFFAAIAQTVFLLKKYFTYPTVEISMKSGKLPVTFPAVTLCNTSPISLTKVNALIEKDSDILSWFSILEMTDFGQHKARLDSQQAFYENLPDLAQDVGHSYDEMIVSCRFNNQDCGADNFTLFFDGKDYYNCYTFTSRNGGNKSHIMSEELNMTEDGPHHGLSLILSVNSQKSQPGTYGIYDLKNPVAYGSGMRVQIHASNTLPTPAHNGFDVPPGYSTSVGLKTKTHSRLSYPYGDCIKTTSDKGKNYHSMFDCLQTCKQKILITKCGCMTSALPTLTLPDTNKNLSFCGEIKNWKNKAEEYKNKHTVALHSLSCEREVMEKLHTNRSYESKCDCSEPCNEKSYEQTMSMSYWPEEFYQLDLLKTLHENANKSTDLVREALDTLTTVIFNYSDSVNQGSYQEYSEADLLKISRATKIVRKNFIRLNIYLQDLSVTEHIQMPAYDLVNLIADIGSTLILWMGISVLTLMEVFELMMALIFLVFNSDTYVMGDKRDTARHRKDNDSLQ